ncbi:16S rRNA (uracil(1498)-N(3))-methyltransferase [Larsenimonas suaedae]|uniref:Ribosomal RNA small subunit methyltransferase E n=1 Tax=Larsenimonas suaedae TaxID=1851019 RepID=A0ABU1GR96_9GAMM|nr:16S rRNA (uracil(1498)-N(3))-methyltransferase [Larsenimonas suaedae]MCM2972652.1 16S rRNA (uracil(1498)-N(3))-methyltransferase [Larsenimonas suaedae]MDR5894551.1 16S rRNA (uracil(1498)-N(3))-methyltransferase [Larsenimonas suaedae]
MSTRLYVDQALPLGQRLSLPEGPARHLATVLRARVDESVRLFDGHGREVEARVTAITRKQVEVEIERECSPTPESPLEVHLGQAISKGDRMDYAIQKAVELGVSEITPLYTERGDVRLKGERAAKKLAHWRGVALSACEQCGRARVPTLHEPCALEDWLSMREEPLRLVLHPGKPGWKDPPEPPEAVSVLIGPEGGLGEAEVERAGHHGFQPLGLGPRVLRTETAPVVALTLLQARYGDLYTS